MVRASKSNGLVLFACMMVLAAALLAGCGPAVRANDTIEVGPTQSPALEGIDTGAVREIRALGLQHQEGVTPTVVYTATFYVGPTGEGLWLDSLGKAKEIEVDGEVTQRLEGTVYRLPWQETEDGPVINEVLTRTVDPPRPHQYVGQWHLDEEPQGFELSIVALEGGVSAGFLFPKTLYGDLSDLPAGINHWYWQVLYSSPAMTQGAPRMTASPTPTGIPPTDGTDGGAGR